MFDKRDKNHDGRLTREEFLDGQPDPDEAPKRFPLFDTDKSGTLNRDEISKVLKHMCDVAASLGRTGPKTEQFVAGVIKKLDADGNGTVTVRLALSSQR